MFRHTSRTGNMFFLDRNMNSVQSTPEMMSILIFTTAVQTKIACIRSFSFQLPSIKILNSNAIKKCLMQIRVALKAEICLN